MNILQINTVDQGGGAAQIASDIKIYLEKRGNIVKYMVKLKNSRDKNTYVIPDKPLFLKISKKIKQFTGRDILSVLKNKLINITANDFQYFKATEFLKNNIYKNSDLIHLHNLHGNYFPLQALIKISNEKPTIWTLHDMWAFTGHCSHSFECTKWQYRCGNCPYLGTYPAINWDNTHNLLIKKANIYKQSKLVIVSPSKWLADKVSKSILKEQTQKIIYNGVDINIFKSQSKIKNRQLLDLPINKKIIMFISGSKNSKWKGIDYFYRILQYFKSNSNVHFLSIGNHNSNISNKNITYISTINDAKILSQYYSASDILLYPSLAETFPLVILEAMACGLPIVSFDIGGVKEALEHKKTGYIAKYKDTRDLINGIKFILTKKQHQLDNMSINAITNIKNNFTKQQMLIHYENLYNQLIKEKN